jgi:small subunit ribosomal protein S3
VGHKVHPYGFRIGIIKPWLAKWYADRDYATLLQEDMRIRELVARQLSNASVSQVEIERGINHVTVTVHTAKPGIVIGKGGANVEALRTNIGKLTDKKVKLEIKEILQPELDGMLLAQNVAGQLERRIAFRKAIKQSIQRTIKAGAKGVKIQVSGRLGGSEMSRTEWDKEGRIPLGTLRADISYGVVHAHTTYGRIGVKAWVYRGEQLGDRPGSARTEPRAARRPAAAPTRGRAATPRPAATDEPTNGAATSPAAPPRSATPVEAAAAPAGPAVETARPAEVTVAEPVTADPTVATTTDDAPATTEAAAPTIATDVAPAAPAAPEPAMPAQPTAGADPTMGPADAGADTGAAPAAPARKPRAPRASTGERKTSTRTKKAAAAPAENVAPDDAAPSADAAEPAGEEG